MKYLVVALLFTLTARTPAPKPANPLKKPAKVLKKARVTPKKVRHGFHTCGPKDPARFKEGLSITALPKGDPAMVVILSMIFRKAKAAKQSERAVLDRYGRSLEGLRDSLTLATVFFEQIEDPYLAVSTVNRVLCRAPLLTEAWKLKLTIEGRILKNRGTEMLNMGPNVMAFAPSENSKNLHAYYTSLRGSMKGMAMFLLKTQSSNGELLRKLYSNIEVAGDTPLMTSFLAKARGKVPGLEMGHLKNLVRQKSYAQALAYSETLPTKSPHDAALWETKTELLKKLNRDSSLSQKRAAFYSLQVEGFNLGYTPENEVLYHKISGGSKGWRKALSKRKGKEKAALLAMAAYPCHNCDDASNAPHCRAVVGELFKLDKKHHGVFEKLLAKGIRCVGTRTILVEALAKSEGGKAIGPALKKYLEMEYNPRIMEKVLVHFSLTRAGRTAHLPQMLSKLFEGNLNPLTAHYAIQSVALFYGELATIPLYIYLENNGTTEHTLASRLCLYGVTGNKTHLDTFQKKLGNSKINLNPAVLCRFPKNSPLLKPITKWKRSKNKVLKDFASRFLKHNKKPSPYFLTAQPTVAKRGLAHGLVKKCRGGNREACEKLFPPLGFLRSKLTLKGQKLYSEIAKKSCELEIPEGCNTMGVMTGTGYIFPKESIKAASYYEKACRLGFKMSCSNLAYMYIIGEGVSKDLKKGTTLAHKACKQKESRGCMYLAQVYMLWQKVPDQKRAAQYWQKACDLGLGQACYNLALHHYRDESKPKGERERLTTHSLALACYHGFSQGCRHLWELIDIKKLLPKKR